MTAVGELVIASTVEPWQTIGLQVTDGVARIGGIALRFVPVAADGREGVISWGLVGSPTDASDIDGLATHHLDAAPDGGRDHALDIVGFDHLVVMTSSLERTCSAIEAATGEPLKRIREAGSIRQGFHRLGELIIEVVESPQVTAPTASFWGFVWNLTDLHETCDQLGPDVVSLPKAAVQPRRFIASVRASVGLGLPLALMTPPSRS
ncbi:MAG TPA: hypothetical protein PK020_17380 [Ilumatobacteraceae bacterium]|nr:hypothetical protein [Ilumatobacteraceae bacterium]HRB04472.1 hypothetical protein [Ilumatobacteraceae bacterium]